MREAYVTLFYGSTASQTFLGLQVTLHSLRRFDRSRLVVVMRLDDELASQTASAAADFRMLRQRFAPVRFVAVPRLLTSSPTCLRHLAGFAMHREEAPHGQLSSRQPASTDAPPLAARSIFSVFNAWNLTAYDRLVWLEADELVVWPAGAHSNSHRPSISLNARL